MYMRGKYASMTIVFIFMLRIELNIVLISGVMGNCLFDSQCRQLVHRDIRVVHGSILCDPIQTIRSAD